jgi:hypothetical protein
MPRRYATLDHMPCAEEAHDAPDGRRSWRGGLAEDAIGCDQQRAPTQDALRRERFWCRE